jgi:integrase
MKAPSLNPKRLSGVYVRGKRFWYRYSHRGFQYRVPLETEDEADAIAKALEIRANPELAQTNTLKHEIKSYLNYQVLEHRFTRNTRESREAVLLIWADAMAVTDPGKISAEMIQDWYQSLKRRKEDPLTESSAQTYVNIVKGFFSHLVRQNKLRRNPAHDVELAPLRFNCRREFCDRDLLNKLISNCDDPELKFVLFSGFHAGLRKEEIIEASPGWFDLDAGLLHVTRSESWVPKDKEDRTIPLTKNFKDFLLNGMRGSDGLPRPYVIQPKRVRRKARYRYDFRKPFAEYMASQGCSWVTPHVMRHTFASLLASRGVSIYKIAKWLGDGVEVTQKHYAHLLPKDEDIDKGFN